jgi:hypothetical protein
VFALVWSGAARMRDGRGRRGQTEVCPTVQAIAEANSKAQPGKRVLRSSGQPVLRNPPPLFSRDYVLDTKTALW